MNGIIASAFERQIVNQGVAVALLLAIALVLVRLVWQPAKRLSIIHWSLIGGLLLIPGLFVPRQLVSLGLLGRHAVDTPTIPQAGLHAHAASSSAASGDSELNFGGDERAIDRIDSSRPLPSFAAVESAHPTHLILWAYITGAMAMLAWLAVGHWRVRWLIGRARAAEGELARSWEQLLGSMQPSSKKRRAVPLLVSDRVSYPLAAGIVRPAVVLPQWLVATSSVEELLPVLAHEAAHTLHRDAVLRWVAAVFQIAFFYQPLYWWLRRELLLCQEYLADARAAAFARSAPEYAEQLVSLLNAGPKRSWRPLPAMGIIEGRSELFHRVRMLLQSRRTLDARGGVRWNLAAGGALLAVAQGLGFVSLWAAETNPASPAPATSDPAGATPAGATEEKPPAAHEEPREVIRRFLRAMNDGDASSAQKLLSAKARETNKEHHFCDGGGNPDDANFIVQDATYPFRDTAHVPVSFGTDGAIYVLQRREGNWLVTGMVILSNSRHELVDFEDGQSLLQIDGRRFESPAEVVARLYAARKRGDRAATWECFSADARQLVQGPAAASNGEARRDETVFDCKIKSTSYPFGETAHVNVETSERQGEEKRTNESIWILKRRQGNWRITGTMFPATDIELPPDADAAAVAAIERWVKGRTQIIDFEDPEVHFRLP